MKRNNHFSSTCIWKITIPRSAYRASEMLIIFNECARYRSDAWKISRRILVHNEFCSQRFPSSGGPRHCNSMKIFFPRNAIHDFFYWTTSRHCPYTCRKYIKYILPLEGFMLIFWSSCSTLIPEVETQMYPIWKIFSFLRSILFYKFISWRSQFGWKNTLTNERASPVSILLWYIASLKYHFIFNTIE